MQVTRSNHFVPQSYLRHWSEGGRQVWCYRLLVPRVKETKWKLYAVGGVAYHRDLYTSLCDGVEIDEFERWIETEFETPAQTAIARAVHGDVLTTSDWERLALYMAAQDVRTPLNYIESVNQWHSILPDVLQHTLEELVGELEEAKRTGRRPNMRQSAEKLPFADTLKVQIDPHARPETHEAEIKVKMVAGRSLWLKGQRHLLEHTAKVLVSHRWGIAEATNDFEWFTSDHPVARVNYYHKGDYDLKGGWGKKHGNLLMPLSPEHLLFTQIGDDIPRRFVLTTAQTSEFQRFIAERAHRMIFARKPMSCVEQLRPRLVNLELYRQEQVAWGNWHDDQRRAEQDLEDGN